MRELSQVALKGKILKFSTALSAKSIPQQPLAAPEWEGLMACTLRRAEAHPPRALPHLRHRPIPTNLSHSVGKWDVNLPNHQNSNIAQFNSFSKLVALKKN